jgi:hypothetical protein
MSECLDLRQQPRKELRQAVRMELWNVAEEQANVHVEATGLDVSSGGIGLATAQQLRPGEVVKISYPLDADALALPVFSEVVWSVMAEGQCRAGLRFLS